MVKLADVQISVPNPTSVSKEDREVRISCTSTVDSNGLFTLTLPDHLSEVASSMTLPAGVSWDRARVHTRLQGKVLEALKKAVTEVLKAFVSPEVTVERVIRYNVESHVSFAEDANGNIFPNGSFPDAQWVDRDHYGEHHATNAAPGGYSLVIGARVCDKRTIRHGDAVKVDYAHVSTDHSGNPNDPLSLLNGWAAFSLPEHGTKDMPYSDEAALFFHRMMLNMAELSRNVQTFMNDEPRLFSAIKNGQLLLGAPQPQPQQA
ncbi:hypothetical protein G3A43_09350 [Paraburkholderia aspalathi]|nr:hypothetical protein [Paraburkholderia aspalathi]MBK3780431.1 hypothetical protein [Paraburkholderia aspalathi]